MYFGSKSIISVHPHVGSSSECKPPRRHAEARSVKTLKQCKNTDVSDLAGARDTNRAFCTGSAAESAVGAAHPPFESISTLLSAAAAGHPAADPLDGTMGNIVRRTAQHISPNKLCGPHSARVVSPATSGIAVQHKPLRR
jgi:hypothetical protein